VQDTRRARLFCRGRRPECCSAQTWAQSAFPASPACSTAHTQTQVIGALATGTTCTTHCYTTKGKGTDYVYLFSYIYTYTVYNTHISYKSDRYGRRHESKYNLIGYIIYWRYNHCRTMWFAWSRLTDASDMSTGCRKRDKSWSMGHYVCLGLCKISDESTTKDDWWIWRIRGHWVSCSRAWQASEINGTHCGMCVVTRLVCRWLLTIYSDCIYGHGAWLGSEWRTD